MMQKRVVSFRGGGNTNGTRARGAASVMTCGGVMFGFNNDRWPLRNRNG